MIRDLSDKESRELLKDKRIGRLGCIADGRTPYVVPVSYVFDGEESIYMHSLPGRKVSAMRDNPRVCLQVDEITDECHWKSVIAYGMYEEITGVVERERAFRRLLRRFQKLTPVESRIAADVNAPAPIVFRVRVETLTGLREG